MKYVRIIEEDFKTVSDKIYKKLVEKGLVYEAYEDNTPEIQAADKIKNTKWRNIYIYTWSSMSMLVNLITVFDIGNNFGIGFYIFFQILCAFFIPFAFVVSKENKGAYKLIYKKSNIN